MSSTNSTNQMTHDQALREMSVERYLLGELTGEPREVFEEHLFECPLCAEDVKSGVAFLQSARAQLSSQTAAKARPAAAQRKWLSPLWLAPALAAGLVAVAYQAAFVEPALRHELAQAETPAIVNDLVLTGGASRSETLPKITAPAHGSFLLSVDIPASGEYSGYVCSLYSPSGAMVWHADLTPHQANDTVLIRVPSAITQAGENTLLVQGVSQSSASGAKLVDLSRHRFVLAFLSVSNDMYTTTPIK